MQHFSIIGCHTRKIILHPQFQLLPMGTSFGKTACVVRQKGKAPMKGKSNQALVAEAIHEILISRNHSSALA
jgi:hypothetical protein